MEELSASKTNEKIKNKGGPILKNAKVVLIFWGKDWNNPSIDVSKERIETAIQNIINSEYYSKLNQYHDRHTDDGIQKPAYLKSVVNDTSHLPQKFEYNDIEKALGDSIRNRSVPDFRSFTNGQIMYILILPRGYYSANKDDAGSDAYHDYFEYKGNDNGVFAIYYGYSDKDRTLEAITRALAHEIAEACTNPGRDDAFVGPKEDEPENEIADYCEDISGVVNGEIVEGYWSNQDRGCVIPSGSNITQDKK